MSSMPITRRRFLLALGALGGGAGAVAWSREVEPTWLRVVERQVTRAPGESAVGETPIRLLHLSDLHWSRKTSWAYLERAVSAGLALKPDLICVTGDYVTSFESFDEDALVVLLARLAQAAPTFGTLGNHDGGSYTAHAGGLRHSGTMGAILERAGVVWLHNRSEARTIRGRKLQLVGLGDLWNGDCRPEEAWRNFRPDPEARIVALSHNPDSKRFLEPYPWHLLLSGHTHGGQCGIPILRERVMPVEDKRYSDGLYAYAGRWMHITRGVGTLHHIRVLCRPEVALLTLV